MKLVGKKLGSYWVIAHIGRGGMGDVYRGVHTELNKEVALKVLSTQLESDEESLERFRRESHTLARFKHPGIVEVFDCDQIDGVSFFSMTLVTHPTLTMLLRNPASAPAGRLPEERALVIAISLLEALTVVHGASVIHRDVKPSNIFVAPDNQAILSDFGVVKLAQPSAELTGEGTVLGTVHYMAPEQLTGGPIDARTDLYSAGLILYLMICGKLPFGSEPAEIMQKKTFHPVLKAPRQICPDVRPELDAIILKSCHREPSMRYQTAEQFRLALVPLAAEVSGLVSLKPKTTCAPAETQPLDGPRIEPRVARVAHTHRRRDGIRRLSRVALWLFAVFAFSCIVLIGLFRWTRAPEIASPSGRGPVDRASPRESANPSATPSPVEVVLPQPRPAGPSPGARNQGGSTSPGRPQMADLRARCDLARHEAPSLMKGECHNVIFQHTVIPEIDALTQCYRDLDSRLKASRSDVAGIVATIDNNYPDLETAPGETLAILCRSVLIEFIATCKINSITGLMAEFDRIRKNDETAQWELISVRMLLAAQPSEIRLLARYFSATLIALKRTARASGSDRIEIGDHLDDLRFLAWTFSTYRWQATTEESVRFHVRSFQTSLEGLPDPIGTALAHSANSVWRVGEQSASGKILKAHVKDAIESLVSLRTLVPAARVSLTTLIEEQWKELDATGGIPGGRDERGDERQAPVGGEVPPPFVPSGESRPSISTTR